MPRNHVSLREPHLAQVGLCTDDLPGSARLYREVFGFADAGGELVSGPMLGKMQGLGEEASCALWWMVGRQDFTQLELFTHTVPPQRPLDPNWRPCDLGWVRWGVAVPDFEAVHGRLAERRVDAVADPITVNGLRRMCFRDPYTGVTVEVMEEGDALPGGVRPNFYDLTPSLSYVALSVSDLETAHKFYVDTIGLVEVDVELHPSESEATWNLAEAVREAIVLRADDIFLEIVRYERPVGQRSAGRRLSDQGFMNVAFGYRDRALLKDMYERVRQGGYKILHPMPDIPSTATYVEDGDGNSVELLSIQREFDSRLGFEPRPLVGGPSAWPQRI